MRTYRSVMEYPPFGGGHQIPFQRNAQSAGLPGISMVSGHHPKEFRCAKRQRKCFDKMLHRFSEWSRERSQTVVWLQSAGN